MSVSLRSMQGACSLTPASKVLFFWGGGETSACQSMFIKAVNNLDDGRAITEGQMMNSLHREIIFCHISLEFCIIRHEEPRLKTGGTLLYLALELMN